MSIRRPLRPYLLLSLSLILILAVAPGGVRATEPTARAVPANLYTTTTRAFTNGPLVPPEAGLGPGSVDGGTATTAFTVLPGDFTPGAVVETVTLDITFCKSSDTCPGPGEGIDWAHEIRFRLAAPNGTQVTLVDYSDYENSSPSVGQVTVTFDDAAPTSVVGLPIQDGTFRPSSGAMADFAGLDPAADGGIWSLELADLLTDDPLCFVEATLYLTVLEPADLSLTKTDLPDPVNTGEWLSYELTVHNAGPGSAVGVVVTDTLDAAVDYVADTGGCDHTDGELVCPLDPIPAGGSREFEILTQVPADAVVTAPDGLGTLISGATVTARPTDPHPDNNTNSSATFVVETADLRAVKLSRPATTVAAGEIFTYTIFVDNLGPSFARQVVVTDTLLSSGAFTLLEVVTDPDRDDGCETLPAPGGASIACALASPLEPAGSAPGNGRWQLQLRARADEGQTVDNTVTVDSATRDPDLSNNQAHTFTWITAVADLILAQSLVGETQIVGEPGGTLALMPDRVTAGAGLTYTLVITNAGPSTAENVTLQDRLPGWIALDRVMPSQGSCNLGVTGDPSTPLICGLGTLTAGSGAAVVVVGQVDARTPGGTWLDSDAMVDSETYDPDNGDNYITHRTQVDAWSDLAIQKQAVPAVAVPGQLITYTLNVQNRGPSAALGAAVVDHVPAGVNLNLRACIGTGGASCGGIGWNDIYDTVTLPPEGALLYTLRGVLETAQVITNTAMVYPPPNCGDPYLADNEASVVNRPRALYLPVVCAGPEVRAADVRVEKTRVGVR